MTYTPCQWSFFLSLYVSVCDTYRQDQVESNLPMKMIKKKGKKERKKRLEVISSVVNPAAWFLPSSHIDQACKKYRRFGILKVLKL